MRLEKQMHDIQQATQLAEQQAHQSLREAPSASPTQASSGLGDMTYATAYSEDQPAPKAKAKAPVGGVKKVQTAAGTAAAKKQALSKKKQREVSSHMHGLMQ
jgi:hypothetical protein